MKSRLLVLAVVIAAISGFYYMTIRPAMKPAQPGLNKRLTEEFRPPEIPQPALPEPKFETPTIPLPLPSAVRPNANASAASNASPQPPLEVPIQPGATIDFSIGAPVIRSQGADKEALDKAIREMAEATKDAKFPPPQR